MTAATVIVCLWSFVGHAHVMLNRIVFHSTRSIRSMIPALKQKTNPTMTRAMVRPGAGFKFELKGLRDLQPF